MTRRTRRRAKRLAEQSLRDTEWQAQEYARVMGKEKLERQQREADLAAGRCVCRSHVIRTPGGYRTIHEPECVKYKDWMAEHVKTVNPIAAAHAAAAQAEVMRVREEAIARADDAVTQSWRDHADEVILATARRLPILTSEDVWDSGLRRPAEGSPDGDALGPAMRRAKVAGIIEDTGKRTEQTNRPQRHNNPKRIWRSLVYEEVASVRPEE